MRKTKEEHEAMKKLLLEVAWYLFEKDGYYHTSLEKIASSAGATRGAIYRNFSWKLDLLEKLLEENHKKYSVWLELDFYKTMSARQKLENIFDIYFWLLANDESFRQVERFRYFEKFIWNEKQKMEYFSKNDTEDFESYVEEIYKQWILTLEFKNTFLPKIFAQTFVSFFLGIQMTFLNQNDWENAQKSARDRLEVFLNWVL